MSGKRKFKRGLTVSLPSTPFEVDQYVEKKTKIIRQASITQGIFIDPKNSKKVSENEKDSLDYQIRMDQK